MTGPVIGEETCHPAVRTMLAYARALARGGRPGGAAIAPPDAGERIFVLDRDTDGRLRVQALGEGLAALFGADLRRRSFAALFAASDHALLTRLLDCCRERLAPAVVRATAETVDGRAIGLELILSPLPTALAGQDRFLGFVQPLAGETGAPGRDTIVRLKIGAALVPFAQPAQRLRLVVNRGD